MTGIGLKAELRMQLDRLLKLSHEIDSCAEYETIDDYAYKHGVTRSSVSKWVTRKQVKGAVLVNGLWWIPQAAKRP
jgi:hypothetical protein